MCKGAGCARARVDVEGSTTRVCKGSVAERVTTGRAPLVVLGSGDVQCSVLLSPPLHQTPLIFACRTADRSWARWCGDFPTS